MQLLLILHGIINMRVELDVRLSNCTNCIYLVILPSVFKVVFLLFCCSSNLSHTVEKQCVVSFSVFCAPTRAMFRYVNLVLSHSEIAKVNFK